MSDSLAFEPFIKRLTGVPQQKRRWLVTETPGVALAYEIHQPEGPLQDLLIFYHGGGAHGRAGYDHMAHALIAAAPVGVCLPDMRGHGASHGPRGHVFPPRLLWNDVDRMVAAMRRAFPDARIHLGAHSSGAGMLLNHLTQRPPRETVDSLILLAPEFGWRAGLYRGSGRFGNFAQVRTWPFLLATCTGGLLGSGLPAVCFNIPEYAESIGCLRSYSVGMANAVTPSKPAEQLRQLDLPTHLAIAEEDQIIDAERLAAFAERNAGPHLTLSRLPNVDHLGIILDAIPFLCRALGHSPRQEKQA